MATLSALGQRGHKEHQRSMKRHHHHLNQESEQSDVLVYDDSSNDEVDKESNKFAVLQQMLEAIEGQRKRNCNQM